MTVASRKRSREATGLDRRTVLAGLAALAASPSAAFANPKNLWTVATQIIAGTRLADDTVLSLAIGAVESEFGASTVDKLLEAVLARDAANIDAPFPDPKVESAARRFVEIVFTGEVSTDSALAFHQALAWQVLPFTKPPSICGAGFGWWTDRPDESAP